MNGAVYMVPLQTNKPRTSIKITLVNNWPESYTGVQGKLTKKSQQRKYKVGYLILEDTYEYLMLNMFRKRKKDHSRHLQTSNLIQK